ncbi:TetR/AcrR family transcriptional regulator [Nesterenkonia suensis]
MAGQTRAHTYGKGREALLEAVVHVVAERGLRGLTYRAVADRAQVNNTLIAHHFGSRDALLVAAVEWAAERSLRLSDLSTVTRIDSEFARTLVDLVRTEPDLQVFQYEMVLESRRRPELRPAVAAFYRQYIGSLTQALEAQGYHGAPVLARVIFAALDGLVIQELAWAVSEGSVFEEAVVKVGDMLASQPRTLV